MFLFTLWAALTLNFFIPRFMPGNPLQYLIAKSRGKISAQAMADMLASFGYKQNANWADQYFSYLGNMLTGNWGVSLTVSPGASIRSMIFAALPWTLGLIGLTTILAFLLGTLIGIVAGWRRGGVIDSWLPTTFVITSALPYFVVGMVLIEVFSVTNHWLPNDYTADNTIVPGFSPGYVGSVLQHAILPAASLLVTAVGGWILTMRNNMITTLAEDYIRMGRAKGLPSRKIMLGYAARNAILPNLSGFAMSLGFVLSGAILVETVFNWPGLGRLAFDSVLRRDYPTILGLLLLSSIVVIVMNLLTDVCYRLIDPRIRTS